MEKEIFNQLSKSTRWMPERNLLPEIHQRLKDKPQVSVFTALVVAASLALLLANIWAINAERKTTGGGFQQPPQSISELNNSYNLY